jgi:hypothetical protein
MMNKRRRREEQSGFLKRRTASMSAPPIYIFSVHGSDNNNFFHIDPIITTLRKMNQLKYGLLLTLAQEEPSWTRTTHRNKDLA